MILTSEECRMKSANNAHLAVKKRKLPVGHQADGEF